VFGIQKIYGIELLAIREKGSDGLYKKYAEIPLKKKIQDEIK
jgi:hypothetical protein